MGKDKEVKKEQIDEEDRDKLAFSSDEFKKLEHSEDKNKSILARVFGWKKEEGPKEDSSSGNENQELVSDLTLLNKMVDYVLSKKEEVGLEDISYTEKIESLKKHDEDSNENVTALNTEVGELRARIMSRERLFGNIETGFDKIREDFHDLEPRRLSVHYGKLDTALGTLQKTIQQNSETVGKVSAEFDALNKMFITMGSPETIIETLESLKQKVEYLNDLSNEVNRVHIKIESLYGNLREGTKGFDRHEDRVQGTEGELNKVERFAHEIGVRMKHYYSKKELNDHIKQQEEKIFKQLEGIERSLEVMLPRSPGTEQNAEAGN